MPADPEKSSRGMPTGSPGIRVDTELGCYPQVSLVDAVDGSSTGTGVPWKWALFQLRGRYPRSASCPDEYRPVMRFAVATSGSSSNQHRPDSLISEGRLSGE